MFLSYPSEHADAALNLGAALRSAGADVWTDRWRVQGLRDRLNLPQRINQAIRDCGVGVVVLSARTINKPWPRAERLALRDLGKPLAFVVIGEATPELRASLGDTPGSLLVLAEPVDRCVEAILDWLQTPEARPRPANAMRSWIAVGRAFLGHAAAAMAGMVLTIACLQVTEVYPLARAEATMLSMVLPLAALRFALWARGIASIYIVDRYLPNDGWTFVWGVAMALAYYDVEAARITFAALILRYLSIFLLERLRGSPGETRHIVSAIYVAVNGWIVGEDLELQIYDRARNVLEIDNTGYGIWMPTMPTQAMDERGPELALSAWETQPLGSDISFQVVLWQQTSIPEINMADIMTPKILRDAREAVVREQMVSFLTERFEEIFHWEETQRHPSRLGSFEATEVLYSASQDQIVNLRYPTTALGDDADRRSVIAWTSTHDVARYAPMIDQFFDSFTIEGRSAP